MVVTTQFLGWLGFFFLLLLLEEKIDNFMCSPSGFRCDNEPQFHRPAVGKNVALPETATKGWLTNPVDAVLISEQLAAKGRGCFPCSLQIFFVFLLYLKAGDSWFNSHFGTHVLQG